MYLGDDTDIVLSYSTFDEADQSSLSLDSHSVQALTGDTALAYDLGISYQDVSDETGFGLLAGLDYYFNSSVNIGFSAALVSVDDFDFSTITIGGDYYVTPSFVVNADYVSLGSDADGDSFVLGAALHF